jgi:hypothetical protein
VARRSLAAALLAAAFLALGSSPARADGDPASDTLIFQNVFLPYPAPQPNLSTQLAAAVRAAYARGYRVKVAVVASANDLGSIPTLFGKHMEYAQFLGTELGLYYVGPLLIVMPSGFGIYDGGRTVAAEEAVIAHLPPPAPTADGLVQAATDALQRLLKAGALNSKDIKPPYAQPYDAVGRRGRPVQLHYMIFDDSGRSSVQLDVRVGSQRVARFEVPMRPVEGSKSYAVTWNVPSNLPVGPTKLCVSGTDPAGNRSPSSCTPLRIR